MAGSPSSAGTKPAGVDIDPSTKFAYVVNSGSNNVSEFTINATTGALRPVSGGPINAGKSPAAASVDPSGKFVFVANSISGDLSAYRINNSTGALTVLVPGPVRARKGPAALAVSSGSTAISYVPKFVYAADFGGGVPALSVSATTGTLTTIPGSPFDKGFPRSISAAPNGKFLVTTPNDNTNGAVILHQCHDGRTNSRRRTGARRGHT
jgi:6-phosphogluconolactonase (cycloisomerase 2 family)